MKDTTMIIVEFLVDHPILNGVRHRAPDSEIRWEETCARPDGPTQMLVWIRSDDFGVVESAIEDDQLVRNPAVVTDLGPHRLYRVDLTDSGRVRDLLPVFMEVGGILQEAIGTEDGWWYRAQFPDRAAFQRIHRFCQAHEIEFEFRRLFESTTEETGEDPLLSLLTEDQREALLLAWDAGYFDIPKRVTLVELAEGLGISDTAVSQRLQRAHRTVYGYLFDLRKGPFRRPLTTA